MGSSSKKHKKESRKHKHRSHSRSPAYSVEKERSITSSVSGGAQKHKHRHSRSGVAETDSPVRIVEVVSGSSVRHVEKERDREIRKHHKKHKKHRHRSPEATVDVDVDRDDQRIVRVVHNTAALQKDQDYHSDSSDVVEVPLAPPAPEITKEKSYEDGDVEVVTRGRPQEHHRRRSPSPPIVQAPRERHKRTPSPPRIATHRERARRSPLQINTVAARDRYRRSPTPPREKRRRSPSPSNVSASRERHRRSPIPSTVPASRQRHHHSRSPQSMPVSRERNRRSPSPPVIVPRGKPPHAPSPPKIREREQKSRSFSPIAENGAGDSLSIQETNKLRAKLGLKPLEVESGPMKKTNDSGDRQSSNAEGLSSYKDEWGEFLHKPATNLAEKLEADKIREKIRQRKEKRALEDKLKKVKGLGDSDEEVDDLKKWIQSSKQKDQLRKEADRREKILQEMDAEFGVGDIVDQDVKRRAYKDRDLKGLRVDHDVDEFSEGKTVILTLKDKGVLDEDDDALINVNMLDDEHYRKNVENRKQKPNAYGYDVYQEMYDELGNPIERGILGKYDEEIGETSKKTFTIGESLDEERENKRKLLEIKTKLAGKRLESLDDSILRPASDTFTESEMETFKKPKKKVKKLRQKLKAEDLLPLTTVGASRSRDFGRRNRRVDLDSILETDDTPMLTESVSNVKVDEDDEEDFQKVLSKARKLKQKETLLRKTFEIDLNDLKSEVKSEANSDEEMNDLKDGNIILNSTAEFCRTLGDIPTYGMAGNRNEDSNDIMNFEEMPAEDDVKEPEDFQSEHGTWNSINPEAPIHIIDDDDEDENSKDVADVAILGEEPDVGSGVAAALKLAVSKGYLEKEDKNRPSNTRMAHLQAKNYSIEDKSHNEDDKFGRRERFYAGPITEFREKDSFKPNVKLEYIDDNGRILNAKEAFRYLSHKFHGKGPGKNKIEKRLKKVEQDGLMMKMSSTDTPLGTLGMLQAKQKETQSAFVVLSGGSKQQSVGGSSISKHK